MGSESRRSPDTAGTDREKIDSIVRELALFRYTVHKYFHFSELVFLSRGETFLSHLFRIQQDVLKRGKKPPRYAPSVAVTPL